MKRINFPVEAGACAGAFTYTFSAFVCLFILLLAVPFGSSAVPYKVNDRTKLYSRQIAGDSVFLEMDNDLSIPVSVKIELSTENLQGSTPSSISVVIPAQASGHILARFKKRAPALSYKLTYSWKIVLGDVTKIPNKSYQYSYPYLETSTYKISQGPGGSFSHQDAFAYDFLMPAGTPVVAARDGIVAMVKDDSKSGGPDRKYIDDANYISVYHDDGTLGNYFHLNTGGSLVKEGQHVKKGEIIGYSGNTGFTSGPHLHFEVIQPSLSSSKNTFVAFQWTNDRPNSFLVHQDKRANL